jgi:hypothetical protein
MEPVPLHKVAAWTFVAMGWVPLLTVVAVIIMKVMG